VPFDVVPEPEPEERAPIATALAALVGEPGWIPGAWWRAGLEHALGASDEGPVESPPPARP